MSEINFDDIGVVRQEITLCGEILGVSYEVEWAVVFLADGSFYIDFPVDVDITDTGNLVLTDSEAQETRASILANVLSELKKAPYFTCFWFGLRYIPNPRVDPDFDPDIDPLEKWGLGG